MNKRYKDNKFKLHFVILGIIIASTFFLSIGYASLESITLDIKGEITALPQNEIFITDVQYSTNVGANTENSVIKQYYQTLMESTVDLGNGSDSSITYNITIYNSGNEPYTFRKVEYTDEFYDNPNIVFDLNGLKQWDVVNPKEYITFSITFHYLNNVPVDNSILNSYLNFKFMKGTVDDTDIRTNIQSVKIYNADTDKIKIDLTNNNDFAVDFNLTLNNNVIGTMSLAPEETKSIEHSIKDRLTQFEPNKEYVVKIEQSAPYAVSKDSSSKLTVIPTITNYDLGFKSAGTEQNPYVVYKIEDLVRFAKNVNAGNAYTNTYIKQINNLDFNNQNDYYNYADVSFGNLNDNATDSNQIQTEMITGTGFPIIGSLETTPFKGIFDGENNRLENVLISRLAITTDIKTALFGYIENAIVRNYSISGAINIVKDGAALVGGVKGNSSVLNCHNYATVTNSATDTSVGGLIGVIMGSAVATVDGCSNNGTISNGASTAGLVGFVISSTLNMSNCYNTGTITSTLATNLKEDTIWTAGLVAKDSSGGGTINIKRSYNTGAINGKFNVGGLVSRISGKLTIDSCYNVGKLNGTQCVGGILGNNSKIWSGKIGDVTIQNSYNIGEIVGTTNIGGIIGKQEGTTYNITKAYYLEKTNLLNIGNISGSTCSRTEEYMKSNDFVTLLGNEFTADTSNTNGGYPILK